MVVPKIISNISELTSKDLGSAKLVEEIKKGEGVLESKSITKNSHGTSKDWKRNFLMKCSEYLKIK